MTSAPRPVRSFPCCPISSGLAKEIGDRTLQPSGQPYQGDESHVELPALDLLKVLQIEVAALCHLLERPFVSLPERSDS
jgi:hypothetical protein